MPNWTKVVNKKGLVFYRDNRTNLLWSPPLADKYNFDQAIALTPKTLNLELGKFKNRTWTIPTRDEIAGAIANGLLDQIPGIDSFWSASVYSYDRSFAWSSSSLSAMWTTPTVTVATASAA